MHGAGDPLSSCRLRKSPRSPVEGWGGSEGLVRSSQDLERDVELAVGVDGPPVTGGQGQVVLGGGGADEGVVDGAAGDAFDGELVEEGTGRLGAQEFCVGEVGGQEAAGPASPRRRAAKAEKVVACCS